MVSLPQVKYFYRIYYKERLKILFPFIKRVLFKKYPKQKRLLGVWDVKSTNVAVGILIEFQIRLLCEAYEKKLDKIDIAFVYDAEKPTVQPKFSFINASNFHYHLSELIPILNTNPKLGSVFFFDHHDEFEKFLIKNQDQYDICPPIFDYMSGLRSDKDVFNIMRNFYFKNKFLPKLEFKEATSQWAKAFIKKYVGDKLAVTVNLRFNPKFTAGRNAKIEAWKEFFTYCGKDASDVKFVILGRQNEIGEKLKGLSNVIFSKDCNTNIEQDLALMAHSFFYMGITSGPASFPSLSTDIPYILTNYTMPNTPYAFWLKHGEMLPWQNEEIQRVTWEPETKEWLIEEFEKLYGKLDKDEWRNKLQLNMTDEKSLSWPYFRD